MASERITSPVDRPAERLRALEAEVGRPLGHLRGDAAAWHELGALARRIRDEGLYRLKGYGSFGGYCWGEWRTAGEMVRRDIDIAAAFRREDLPQQRVARGALWQAARAPEAARATLLDLLLRGGLRVADVAAGREAAEAAARSGAAPEAVSRAAEDAALAAALRRPPPRATSARGEEAGAGEGAGEGAGAAGGGTASAMGSGDIVRRRRPGRRGVSPSGAPVTAGRSGRRRGGATAGAAAPDPAAAAGAGAVAAVAPDPAATGGVAAAAAAAAAAAGAVAAVAADLAVAVASVASGAGVSAAADEVDALCADYEPAPLVVSPILPPPEGWREDPGARLADPVLVGGSGPGAAAGRGTLGRLFPGRLRVSLALDGSLCLSTFSVPGGGKSYLCTNVLQMALQRLPHLNELPRPRCGVLFHYPAGGGYEPEVLAALRPNGRPREALTLMEDYGALPRGFEDVVLLVPREQVLAARRRHPHLRVHPILFSPTEPGTQGWQALLGINDESDGTLYARRLRLELGELRGALSLAALEARLGAADLSGTARSIIAARLGFVRPFLSERYPLRRLLRPGRLLVVDVRDEWVPRKEALTLLSLVTSVLGRRPAAGEAGGGCDLALCFDEAHRYLQHRPMRAEIERLVRERRHLGLMILLASQDPMSVPPELIGLSDVVALGKIQSEEWLRRLTRSCGAFKVVKPHVAARMGEGRMLLWAERVRLDGVDPDQLLPVNPLQVRPLAAHPGG